MKRWFSLLVLCLVLICNLSLEAHATTVTDAANRRTGLIGNLLKGKDAFAKKKKRRKRNKYGDPVQVDKYGRRLPRISHVGLPTCPSFPFCDRIPLPPPMDDAPAEKPLPFDPIAAGAEGVEGGAEGAPAEGEAAAAEAPPA